MLQISGIQRLAQNATSARLDTAMKKNHAIALEALRKS